MKVYAAINAIQRALAQDGIAKERTNEQQRYKFRGIDDIYNALAPLLAQHGLCILPRMQARECETRMAKSGGTIFTVTVHAKFDFVCSEDGSRHVVRTYGEAMDTADKATHKAMSAAYKYACIQAFCIPTEGDNDADANTPEVGADQKNSASPYAFLPYVLREMRAAKTMDALKEAYSNGYRAHHDNAQAMQDIDSLKDRRKIELAAVEDAHVLDESAG